MNQPIARFDPKSGKVYMEHADGTKTLVGEAVRKGGYRENKSIKKPEIVDFCGAERFRKEYNNELTAPSYASIYQCG